jgi:ADP-dependent NAD(P)H-hydrate dehydratase / NAD(P)H-hydrate epimerase
MQPVISAQQMGEIDRLTVEQYGLPSLLLMEAAADSCFRAITDAIPGGLSGKTAQVLCGPGNNGGDGAALARILANSGVHTDVVLFGSLEDVKGDARTNFDVLSHLASFSAGSSSRPSPLTFATCESVKSWEEIARPRTTYDILIDALFGTGLTRPLEGLFLKVVQHLEIMRSARNRASGICPLIVSVDIPSGLNADLAQPIGEAVHADLTVTFTAPKPATVLPPASNFSGKLTTANIGSPAALIDAASPNLFVTEESDARLWLQQTRYTPESYKNTHGHLLVVAGSRGYTGAAALCANGAMRSGVGLVTVATAASCQDAVAAQCTPEVITSALAETDRGAVTDSAVDYVLQLSRKATAIAIGPGLSASDERTRAFVRNVVANRSVPIIIDADALNCLSPWPKDLSGSSEVPVVLTPHLGEFQRLLGTEKAGIADRVASIRSFALEHNLLLLLKGSRSLLAEPNGKVFVNPTGNPGLGTAGAGDTLTGIIGGFLAQAFAIANGPDALNTTLAALYIAGLAGDLAAAKVGMRALIASDVRDNLSAAITLLDPEGEIPHTTDESFERSH